MPVAAALTPAHLARILSLRLRARAVLEGALAGVHRSPFHGYSSEFAQYRGYAPGDDLRHLDWKVLGRRDQLVTRQYRDETNASVHLLVDTSASMGYGESGGKLEYARILAASIALLAERQRDALALAHGAGDLEASLPPSGGPRATREVIRRLEALSPGGRTDLEALLTAAAARIRGRGFAFLFTDLWQEPGAVAAGLRRLRAKSRAATVVQLRTRDEEEFFAEGAYRLRDLETGEELEVSAPQARSAYAEAVHAHSLRIAAECSRLDLRLVPLRTDWPCDAALRRILAGAA